MRPERSSQPAWRVPAALLLLFQLACAVAAAVYAASYAGSPLPLPQPLPKPLPQPLPQCGYDDLASPGIAADQWRYALVDTRYRLPAEFVPSDLVPLRGAGFDDDRTLRRQAAADLAELLRAAEREGVRFELQSAYRSYEYQRQVFAGWVESLGREQALRTSARPGHSEHQLGTAVDLRSAGGRAPWELTDWAETREGSWLRENAWRFGFVMSYPQGKEELTCYDYEPWHYRWLGREAAAALRSEGVTPREWLWRRLSAGQEE
jgi:D-alanyl-D-alanine carboxypeptidase